MKALKLFGWILTPVGTVLFFTVPIALAIGSLFWRAAHPFPRQSGDGVVSSVEQSLGFENHYDISVDTTGDRKADMTFYGLSWEEVNNTRFNQVGTPVRIRKNQEGVLCLGEPRCE